MQMNKMVVAAQTRILFHHLNDVDDVAAVAVLKILNLNSRKLENIRIKKRSLNLLTVESLKVFRINSSRFI